MIDPARDLGHVDREHHKEKLEQGSSPAARRAAKEPVFSDGGGRDVAKSSGLPCGDDDIVEATGLGVAEEPKKELEQGKKGAEACEDCA